MTIPPQLFNLTLIQNRRFAIIIWQNIDKWRLTN